MSNPKTSSDKLTTLGHLRALAEKAQGAIATVAGAVYEALEEQVTILSGKADKAAFATASIAANAWVTNTDTTLRSEGYNYMADLPLNGVAATDSAEAVVAKASRQAARSCGMADTTDTLAGAVRFYAVSRPGAALTVQIRIIQGGT